MKRIAIVVAMLAVIPLPAPAQEEDPKPKGGQDHKRLVAIGGLSASALYLSFTTIGLTADGFEKGIYDEETAKKLAGEVKGLLKVNAGQLEDLLKDEKGEKDEDRKGLKEVVEIAGMLGEYADLLVAYTKAKDAKVGEKFQAKRKATWDRLKTFMGIK